MAWSLKQNPDYGELVESKIVIRRSLQLKKRLKQKIFLLLEHLDCPKQATQERKDSNKKLCPIAISSQIDITRGKKRTLRIKSKELVSQLSQRRSACQEEESICESYPVTQDMPDIELLKNRLRKLCKTLKVSEKKRTNLPLLIDIKTLAIILKNLGVLCVSDSGENKSNSIDVKSCLEAKEIQSTSNDNQNQCTIRSPREAVAPLISKSDTLDQSSTPSLSEKSLYRKNTNTSIIPSSPQNVTPVAPSSTHPQSSLLNSQTNKRKLSYSSLKKNKRQTTNSIEHNSTPSISVLTGSVESHKEASNLSQLSASSNSLHSRIGTNGTHFATASSDSMAAKHGTTSTVDANLVSQITPNSTETCKAQENSSIIHSVTVIPGSSSSANPVVLSQNLPNLGPATTAIMVKTPNGTQYYILQSQRVQKTSGSAISLQTAIPPGVIAQQLAQQQKQAINAHSQSKTNKTIQPFTSTTQSAQNLSSVKQNSIQNSQSKQSAMISNQFVQEHTSKRLIHNPQTPTAAMVSQSQTARPHENQRMHSHTKYTEHSHQHRSAARAMHTQASARSSNVSTILPKTHTSDEIGANYQHKVSNVAQIPAKASEAPLPQIIQAKIDATSNHLVSPGLSQINHSGFISSPNSVNQPMAVASTTSVGSRDVAHITNTNDSHVGPSTYPQSHTSLQSTFKQENNKNVDAPVVINPGQPRITQASKSQTALSISNGPSAMAQSTAMFPSFSIVLPSQALQLALYGHTLQLQCCFVPSVAGAALDWVNNAAKSHNISLEILQLARSRQYEEIRAKFGDSMMHKVYAWMCQRGEEIRTYFFVEELAKRSEFDHIRIQYGQIGVSWAKQWLQQCQGWYLTLEKDQPAISFNKQKQTKQRDTNTNSKISSYPVKSESLEFKQTPLTPLESQDSPQSSNKTQKTQSTATKLTMGNTCSSDNGVSTQSRLMPIKQEFENVDQFVDIIFIARSKPLELSEKECQSISNMCNHFGIKLFFSQPRPPVSHTKVQTQRMRVISGEDISHHFLLQDYIPSQYVEQRIDTSTGLALKRSHKSVQSYHSAHPVSSIFSSTRRLKTYTLSSPVPIETKPLPWKDILDKFELVPAQVLPKPKKVITPVWREFPMEEVEEAISSSEEMSDSEYLKIHTRVISEYREKVDKQRRRKSEDTPLKRARSAP